jgi:hypothetical protein
MGPAVGVQLILRVEDATTRVAVIVDVADTPVALKVMPQEWLPTVAPPVFTEALRLAGVDPLFGLRPSHAQSGPSDVLKLNPLDGLVLFTEMLCAEGTVPPMV